MITPGKPSRWQRPGSFRIVPLAFLILSLLAVAFYEPVIAWLTGENRYDQAALIEWIEETRNGQDTLPEMVEGYLKELALLDAISPAQPPPTHPDLDRWIHAEERVSIRQEEIHEHLASLGTPATKIFPGQLILFPTIYRLEIRFTNSRYHPIIWDSEIPIQSYGSGESGNPQSPYRVLHHPVGNRANLVAVYQLHATRRQQRVEEDQKRRLRQVLLLLGSATLLTGVWFYLAKRRDSERERQREQANLKADMARKEKEEAERVLLEQRLAAQTAEKRVLELQSQLYASIGIMAGSYAHNIKNLLVRPNDLLQRCLESHQVPAEQVHLLEEVRGTLGMVNDRLQEILRTVRRDPANAERTRLDLNALAEEILATWGVLARDKWKLNLQIDLAPGGLFIQGDRSHLQQALENLLFNARDATFEMRNHLRLQARLDEQLDSSSRRQSLIQAAGWKGSVTIRTRYQEGKAILEVVDNGIGMDEETRRKCTDTHFTTKRNNALYEGHNTGTGLGLSFVSTIIDHHGGKMEILSRPLEGALFRLIIPGTQATVDS